MAPITTVLLDLDGVMRHFDPEHVASVEAENGLVPGALMAAAFEPGLIASVVTGQITRAEWTVVVGLAVGSPVAAEQWLGDRGSEHLGVVDDQMLVIVERLRASGVVVAILTNGTDTIPAEMVELGLDQRFDAIFNTAEIGYAKPDRRAFEHVCSKLGVSPAEVFFTDDSETKLAGAIEIGVQARHFVGVEAFKTHLDDLGLSY